MATGLSLGIGVAVTQTSGAPATIDLEDGSVMQAEDDSPLLLE